MPAALWRTVLIYELWRRLYQTRALASHDRRREDPLPDLLRLWPNTGRSRPKRKAPCCRLRDRWHCESPVRVVGTAPPGLRFPGEPGRKVVGDGDVLVFLTGGDRVR